jgi:hypothetical protein
VFLDVDYPELIRHKSSIVRQTEELADAIQCKFGDIEGEIHSERYHAVGCDLSDLTRFHAILQNISISLETASILFISEVAITYMVFPPSTSLI